MPMPAIGQIVNGHKYVGGNPNTPGAWQQVGPASSVPGAPTEGAATATYNADLDRIKASREEVAKHVGELGQLDTFKTLNKIQGTGGVTSHAYDGFDVVNPVNWIGMAGQAIGGFMRDPEVQQMNAITTPMQGQVRPAGSGATSNFEQKLYRAGVPSVDKVGNANTGVANQRAAIIKERQDELDFQENYLANNRTLNGAEQAWAQYVAANPYTTVSVTPKGDHVIVLNPQRKDWRAHFNVGAPTPAASAPAAQRPKGASGPPAGVTKLEWDHMTPQERALWPTH